MLKKSLAIFLLLLCKHAIVAQENVLKKDISVEYKNTRLAQVLEDISSKANIHFSYSSSSVNLDEKITLSASNLPLQEALDKILIPLHIKWTLIGNQIALKSFLIFKICGKISDSVTKEPLQYVSLGLKGTAQGSTTDFNGNFCLTNIQSGTYTLVVNAMGYVTFERQVKINSASITLDIDLSSRAIELNEAIITSDKIIEHTSVSEKQINQAQIEAANGISNDPVKTITTLPGVAAKVNLFGPSDIHVRGGEPFENVFLLDNIKLPFPFYIIGQSVFNPEMLEKAEILTGGFAPNYGNAMSSVFNLTTKNGDTEHFRGNINMSIFNTTALIQGPIIKNRLSFIIGFRKSNLDLLSLKSGINTFKMWDVTGKLTFDINSKNKLNITLLDVNDKLNFPSTSSLVPSFSVDNTINAENLQLQSVLSEKLYSKTSFLHSGLRINAGAGEQYHDLTDNSYGLREDISYYPKANAKIKAGFELNYEKQKAGIIEKYNTTDISYTDSVFLTHNYILNTGNVSSAIYAFYDASVFKRINLNAGGRLDYNQLNNLFNFSPRLTLAYSLTNTTIVSGSWGYFNQAPDLYQLSQNNQLKTNQCIHSIISVKQKINSFLIATVEGYYKDYTKQVLFDSLFNYSNSGYGTSKGLEFMVRKEQGRLNGWVSYVLSKSDRKRSLQDAVYPYYFDQRHSVGAVINYTVKEKKRKWFVPTLYSLEFRFATGTPYTPIINVDSIAGKYELIAGSVNSYRNPNYNNLNAKIQWQRSFGKEKQHLLQYYINFWNLYGKPNILERTYGISSAKTISIKNNYTMPFLPNIGIKINFNYFLPSKK
jgi:outer membrane receptor protein involved in Fe transport